MKNITTRRTFLLKLAFITSALFLLTSVSQLQAFNFEEGSVSDYHPYVEENTDSGTFDVNASLAIEIECPGALLSENSVAVVYSTFMLWSPSGNQAVEQALNAALGSGNWDAFDYNTADASVLFGGTYGYVYLEGGDHTANQFAAFIAANGSLIEQWVNDGGHLFMNAGPNQGGHINLGFGGFTLLFDIDVTGNTSGLVQEPAHPVFNGPLTPANGNFSGGYFGHAVISSGGIGTTLITGENTGNIVIEYPYGSGIVVFGGLTTPNFHAPYPNGYNWLSNLHTYLNQPGMSKITVEVDNGMCGYTHNGTDWDATATGTVASLEYELTGATTGNGTSLDSVAFNLGETIVTWTATDVDTSTEVCSFKVIVEDNEDPEITCVGDQTPVLDANSCIYTHSGTDWDTTADDDCSVASLEYELTGATIGSGTSLDGMEFNLGVTTVIWTATDDSSNTAVCSFTVTVEDNEAPEITCVGNQTPTPDANTCTYVHSGTDWDAIATDNCGIDTLEFVLTGVTSGSGNSLDGVEFNFGITTVTWTATDAVGNSNACSFTVFVYSQDCIPHKLIKISPDTTNEIIKIIIPSEVVINSVILNDENGADTGIPFVNGEMDLSSLSEGIYFLTVDTDKGVVNQTIVKM